MGRTQSATVFTLHQEGNYLGDDPSLGSMGARWTIVAPPLELVPPGGQLYGNWTVDLTMQGLAVEKYAWHDNYPFPMTYQNGLWRELALHRVEGLEAHVHSVGPDGAVYDQVFTYEDWVNTNGRCPYMPQFTGEDSGMTYLECGVWGTGFHRVSATVMGQPLTWAPCHERINDQHTPPSGQFAEITVTETQAEVVCASGADERFRATVEAQWTLPFAVRVSVGCTDFEGQPVNGRRLFVLFGPLMGSGYRKDHPLLQELLFERRTPLDEEFRFPLRRWWQHTRVDHMFLGGASGNPNPPFPREHTWGSRDFTSGLSAVGLAVAREEFGMAPAPFPIDDLLNPEPDYRNWPQCQFHPDAGGTAQHVGTLTLSPTLDLPALAWVGSGASGSTLSASGSVAYHANLAPAFECRPYRYLHFTADASAACGAKLTLKQGSTAKSWNLQLAEGAAEQRVDLIDPDEVNGTERGSLPETDSANMATAVAGGALSSRFTGIAGLTSVELTFADRMITVSGWALKADSAWMRPIGDGLLSQNPDEALHSFYGQVDGRDAFRLNWVEPDIQDHMDQMGKRMHLAVSGEDYSISPDFQWRYDSWDQEYDAFGEPIHRIPNPGSKHVASFDSSLQPLGGESLFDGFPLKMTIVGRGYVLHPCIGENAMFVDYDGGGEPFRCRFELLWGWGASATAVGGGARLSVSRAGDWQERFAASPYGQRSALPPKPYQGATADVVLADEAHPERMRSLRASAMRQMAWMGLRGDPAAGGVHSARHSLGCAVEAITDATGVAVVFRGPGDQVRTSRVIEGAGVSDAQAAVAPDGFVEVAYVVGDSVRRVEQCGFGEGWSAPEMITDGDAVAIAIEPRSGAAMLAVSFAGVWTAWLRRTAGSDWEERGIIVSAAAARAGLEIEEDGLATAVFCLPASTGIRRFTSSDLGQTWTEIN